MQELLEQIPPFALDTEHECPLLLFLVTPSFAAQAVENLDLFAHTIRKAIKHTDQDSIVPSFQTLVAVVDRLPLPVATLAGKSEKLFAKFRTRAYGKNRLSSGLEGIAFASISEVPRQSASKSDTDNNTTSRGRRMSLLSSSNKPGTLTFKMKSHIVGDERYSSYEVQLPLTNSVFLNGLASTLIRCQYNWDARSGELTQVWKENEDHQAVTLPCLPYAVRGVGTNISASAPLVALTPARVVAACMGNIVRQVFDGSEDNAHPVLASQELEAAVSDYFKAKDIPAQTVSVWALVVPKEAAENIPLVQPILSRVAAYLRAHWKADVDKTLYIGAEITRFGEAFEHGVKLCRVMSGGGGWGKKAGLLSLDPDTNYDAASEAPEPSFFSELALDGSTEDASPLEQVARVGDYVQFYIAPVSTYPEPPSVVSRHELDSYQETLNPWRSTDFGVIPSTIDTLSVVQTAGGAGGETVSCRVFKHHFGAFSEGGMALTVRQYSVDAPVAQQTTQSRIDVPYSRYSIYERMKDSKAQGGSQTVKMDGEVLSTPVNEPTNQKTPLDLDQIFEAFETIRTQDDEGGSESGSTQGSALSMNFKPTEPRRSDDRLGARDRRHDEDIPTDEWHSRNRPAPSLSAGSARGSRSKRDQGLLKFHYSLSKPSIRTHLHAAPNGPIRRVRSHLDTELPPSTLNHTTDRVETPILNHTMDRVETPTFDHTMNRVESELFVKKRKAGQLKGLKAAPKVAGPKRIGPSSGPAKSAKIKAQRPLHFSLSMQWVTSSMAEYEKRAQRPGVDRRNTRRRLHLLKRIDKLLGQIPREANAEWGLAAIISSGQALLDVQQSLVSVEQVPLRSTAVEMDPQHKTSAEVDDTKAQSRENKFMSEARSYRRRRAHELHVRSLERLNARLLEQQKQGVIKITRQPSDLKGQAGLFHARHVRRWVAKRIHSRPKESKIMRPDLAPTEGLSDVNTESERTGIDEQADATSQPRENLEGSRRIHRRWSVPTIPRYTTEPLKLRYHQVQQDVLFSVKGSPTEKRRQEARDKRDVRQRLFMYNRARLQEIEQARRLMREEKARKTDKDLEESVTALIEGARIAMRRGRR